MKAVALLIVATLTAHSAIAAPNIAGLWSADERTKGGLGSQWLFSGDGHVTMSFGAIVDFTYRVEGNKLITTFSQAGEPPEESTAEFVVSGDVLTINPNDTETKQVMKRMGLRLSGVSPIVGAWTYQHYTGAQAIDRYSSNGRMLLSVPFQTVEGTYQLLDGRVTINLEGQRPSDVSVEVSGSTMIMTDHGTKHVFTRFDF
jgi:hypothetical protein